tara:strand:- start:546 stop:854 length:309 start_codon:yes stop_codon:yes gene_type:complete
MSMHSALTARFDDIDEIRDVANYGCAAGVSGFIYYSETCAFYDEHEQDILDYLADCDISIKDVCHDDDCIDTLKNRLVWTVVEMWCQAQDMVEEMRQVALAS